MLGLGSGSHLLHLCSLELSLTGVQLALASCDLYPEGLARWPHPGAVTCLQIGPGPASLFSLLVVALVFTNDKGDLL